MSLTLGLSSNNLKTMADREKKVKMEIQKFEYLEKENRFLDEMENIFTSYGRAIIWKKIEI